MEEKAIVPHKEGKVPSEKPILYEKEFTDFTSITKANFYKVRGRDGKERTEPDARVLRSWANAKRIKTEMVSSERTEEYATITMRGWVGDKDNPITETTATVDVFFKDLEREWLIQNLQRHGGRDPRARYDSDLRTFVPTSPEATIDLLKYINRKKIFSIRDCETKAEKRLFKKLLGAEWREKEEIEEEEAEVKMVGEEIKNQSTGKTMEDQISEIKDLTANNNGKADIAREFLQVLGKEYLNQLSSTEASELITKLKA